MLWACRAILALALLILAWRWANWSPPTSAAWHRISDCVVNDRGDVIEGCAELPAGSNLILAVQRDRRDKAATDLDDLNRWGRPANFRIGRSDGRAVVVRLGRVGGVNRGEVEGWR